MPKKSTKKVNKVKKMDKKTSTFKTVVAILVVGLLIIAALYVLLGPERGAIRGKLITSGGGAGTTPDPIPDTPIEENETTQSGVQWNPGGGSRGGGSSSSGEPEEEYDITIDKKVKWAQPWTDCVYGAGPFLDQIELPTLPPRFHTITFQLSIQNNEDTTVELSVIDHLPEGITYRGYANIPCVPYPDKANRDIEWILGEVQSGEVVNITFVATVRESGTLVNVAEVLMSKGSDTIKVSEDSATIIVGDQNQGFFFSSERSNTIFIR